MITYNINSTKRSNYPVLVLFFLLALTSLSFNTSHAQYSGEDLFRAIYFGEGSATNGIDELEGVSIRNYTNDASELSDALLLQNQIVTAINSSNPEFMSGFQGAMTSKNHVTIKAKLNEGQQVLSNAAASLEMDRNPEFEQEVATAVANSLGHSVATFDGVGQAIDEYLAQRQASNSDNPAMRCRYIYYIAYVWIIVYIEWYFDPEEDLAASHQDQLVNSIARNF